MEAVRIYTTKNPHLQEEERKEKKKTSSNKRGKFFLTIDGLKPSLGGPLLRIVVSSSGGKVDFFRLFVPVFC